MSQKLSHVLYSTKIMLVFRIVLIIVGLIFVILSPVYGAISTKKFNGLNKILRMGIRRAHREGVARGRRLF